jgi:RTX calcium-binding nonapeptide repeat (4 copies)
MAGRLAAALALAGVACLLPVARPVAAGTRGSSCFGRSVTIMGTDEDGVIRGTRGGDVINGRRGDDTIWGLGGNDRLCGGYGDDRVYGNTRRDWVKGGPGDDRADGGRDTDFVIVFDHEPGNDWADGGLGVRDGCSVDAGYPDTPGDGYTEDCEDVVGAGPGALVLEGDRYRTDRVAWWLSKRSRGHGYPRVVSPHTHSAGAERFDTRRKRPDRAL